MFNAHNGVNFSSSNTCTVEGGRERERERERERQTDRQTDRENTFFVAFHLPLAFYAVLQRFHHSDPIRKQEKATRITLKHITKQFTNQWFIQATPTDYFQAYSLMMNPPLLSLPTSTLSLSLSFPSLHAPITPYTKFPLYLTVCKVS